MQQACVFGHTALLQMLTMVNGVKSCQPLVGSYLVL
jgi:hypothetical protein